MREAISAKFHPAVFRTGPTMTAILGMVLGERWTEPTMDHLTITSDGFVVTMGDFIGCADDLARNLSGACDAAGLTAEERAGFGRLVRAHVTDCRVSFPAVSFVA
jgi:hypothetical protein